MSLFAYGTLMFAEVWKRIGIQQCDSQPAILPGYAIYRIRGALIPGIIRTGPEDQVQGVVYHGLDETTLEELDVYESDLYQRSIVHARSFDSEPLECQAYVIPAANRKVLSAEVWDADWFKRQGLAQYLRG